MGKNKVSLYSGPRHNNMNRPLTRFTVSGLILACLVPLSATAAGLALSPARLSVDLTSGQANATSFTASNPEAQTQAFEVYADDLPSFIHITPQVFTLPPGGIKKVVVEVSAETPSQAGRPPVSLSVVSRPLGGSGLQVATGAKLLLEIRQTPAPTPLRGSRLLIGLVALGSLIAAAAWQNLKK